MAALIENEEANEYVRAAAMTGLLTLCACGMLDRGELMAYFAALFHRLKREPTGAWDWLADSCADLCPEEVMEELQKAYEEGLVDPRVIAWDDIKEALALGKDAAVTELQTKRRYSLVTDVHEEMSWWYCFNPDKKSRLNDDDRLFPEYDEDLLLNSDFVVDPIYRSEPKIGRNEPCPCGSGKKFKKCCGGLEPPLGERLSL
jgi:uncharacterized protein YchJ